MPIIAVTDVSKSFGPIVAVDDLSLTVEPGEIFALLGPNGAGKSTTIKMILGMVRPDRGTISFDGNGITPSDNSYKARIGYMPETCALYENLTGREYLSLICELRHLPVSASREKADKLLYMLELSDEADQMIREYSKGMKQKILMISAMIHNPDVLILDEPFSGLDANASATFKEILREQARQGKAVIFCSHVLEVVERLVDRLIIIKKGRGLVTGRPEEIMQNAERDTLEQVFNELTGFRSAGAVASDIMNIITRRDDPYKHE
jgi:ABC-2 type transport system ATP-binding protein